MARRSIEFSDRLRAAILAFAAGVVVERRFRISDYIQILAPRPPRPVPSVKSFVLEYRILSSANAHQIPGQLRQGQGDIDAHIGPEPCRLVADPDGDPTGRAPPRAVSNGTPGQIGYTVSVITINPENLAHGMPPECVKLSIDEAVAYIGGRHESLGLRQQTRV